MLALATDMPSSNVAFSSESRLEFLTIVVAFSMYDVSLSSTYCNPSKTILHISNASFYFKSLVCCISSL